ncbi:hypothetical protein DENSPDRAFT_789529 [Dentipellis sp. KUC8613]|nr:hypothetical protein DENSPDRAFT_789529 [Dentipellis sp. KUC8613]
MESDRDIERRREAARADNIRGLDWGRGLEQFQHPQFLFSKCTGRKKALCIGINYAGQSRPLHGCVNDAKSVYRFLIKYYHYDPKNIILLTDDARNPRDQPTRANMLAAMRWLVKGARPHDSLFFHYSGHGGQTRDKNGDEVDGYDEIIFPVDYQRAGDIVDDDLHHIMVRPLPPGCRLTAVFDSCHSGSVLDLPYMYHSNGRLKGSDVAPRYKKIKATPAEVICWSGCKDSGTSADTQEGGLPVGAMSYAFLKVLKRNPKITYRDLLRGLKDVTRRYKQKPQLSAGHHIVCPAPLRRLMLCLTTSFSGHRTPVPHVGASATTRLHFLACSHMNVTTQAHDPKRRIYIPCSKVKRVRACTLGDHAHLRREGYCAGCDFLDCMIIYTPLISWNVIMHLYK